MAELSANDFTNINGPALGDGSNLHSTYETVALQHQPLPEYTKNWGPHLYRPAKLPDNYDTRIDPAHIFVFTVHPITGIQRDFYVTPKPCDYCAKVRQLCSRTRPHCGRCGAREERQCVFEEGWVRLPGPKCLKPKRKRDEGGKDVTKKPKKPRASGAQAADTLDTGKAGPSVWFC
ncbi:hypothetical protein BC629DRAFT_19897 [Irpex lacteus]|nr:hypothetical protein BC629DRAFT_19897 [Irpex lacteus]